MGKGWEGEEEEEEEELLEGQSNEESQSRLLQRNEPSGRHRQALQTIVLGQVIAVCVAASGIFSSLLVSRGVSLPTLQSTLVYVLLALHLCRRRRPHVTFWKFVLAAALDVEANFLVVLAYRYTSITSVMLLDCLAIPMVMLYSRYLFKSRYTWLHGLGVLFSVMGLVCTLESDNHQSASGSTRRRTLLGDLLCVAGAALYGASNVLQESLVSDYDPVRYLGLLGAFGTVISVIQAALMGEVASLIARGGLRLVEWGLVTGFAAALWLMYTLTAQFLSQADATLFNLSLLTSDVYAVVYRWAQGAPIDWIYGLAFLLTLFGLLVYNRAPNSNPKHLLLVPTTNAGKTEYI